jgi:TfoX/Sxy family transcriptional regulator of competence genes
VNVTPNRKPPAPKHSPEQVEKGFRIYMRLFASAYAEQILNNPDVMRHAAQRSLEAAKTFEQVAS